jgi:hypothetical protein
MLICLATFTSIRTKYIRILLLLRIEWFFIAVLLLLIRILMTGRTLFLTFLAFALDHCPVHCPWPWPLPLAIAVAVTIAVSVAVLLAFSTLGPALRGVEPEAE